MSIPWGGFFHWESGGCVRGDPYHLLLDPNRDAVIFKVQKAKIGRKINSETVTLTNKEFSVFALTKDGKIVQTTLSQAMKEIIEGKYEAFLIKLKREMIRDKLPFLNVHLDHFPEYILVRKEGNSIHIYLRDRVEVYHQQTVTEEMELEKITSQEEELLRNLYPGSGEFYAHAGKEIEKPYIPPPPPPPNERYPGIIFHFWCEEDITLDEIKSITINPTTSSGKLKGETKEEGVPYYFSEGIKYIYRILALRFDDSKARELIEQHFSKVLAIYEKEYSPGARFGFSGELYEVDNRLYILSHAHFKLAQQDPEKDYNEIDAQRIYVITDEDGNQYYALVKGIQSVEQRPLGAKGWEEVNRQIISKIVSGEKEFTISYQGREISIKVLQSIPNTTNEISQLWESIGKKEAVPQA